MTKKTLTAALFVTLAVIYAEAESKEIVHVASSNGRLEKYETSGASLGGFSIPRPYRVAVDGHGNTYVTPMGPASVLKFDPNGMFLNLFAPPTPLASETGPVFPLGTELGPDGSLYLGVNSGSDRIERYTLDGSSLGIFATTPSAGAPFAIAFDSLGNMYVPDRNRIEQYDSGGTYTGTFATAQDGFAIDMAFDSHGNLYVSSFSGVSSIIKVFNASGSLVNTIHPGAFVNCIAFDGNDVLYVGVRDAVRRFLRDGTPLDIFVQLPPPPPHRLIEVTDIVFTQVTPEPSSLILLFFAFCGVQFILPSSVA